MEVKKYILKSTTYNIQDHNQEVSRTATRG